MDALYNTAMSLINTSLIEPYQPEGVRWMLRRETETLRLFEEDMPMGGILADEVGLGKTILSICVMLGNMLKKTLIILPKSLVCQWESQIKKFAPSMRVFVLYNKKDVIVEDGVYLISQSMLNCRNTVVGSSPVHNVEWDRVIIDEAHMLRNCKSKMYEACCLLKSRIRWALTATPVMNRMTDFVNIMKWIGVSQFLCQGEKDAITTTFILRRTKDDVKIHNKNLNMMDCNVQIKYIPFSSVDEATFYMRVFTTERKKIKNAQNNNTTDLLEHLLRVRQLCIHPQLYLDGMSRKTGTSFGTWDYGSSTKVNALLQSMKEQPKKDKSLVFCQFVKEMDIYMKILSSEGYNCVRLDGTMSMAERDGAVKQFKTDPSINVFIIQINTGGQGINLQVANRIYIMSPNWNPAIEYQAIGRAHRTGQRKHVFVTKFCISSGDPKMPFIEENIIKLQERKKEIIANILKDPRIVNDGTIHLQSTSLGSGLTSQDVRLLFNIHQHTET